MGRYLNEVLESGICPRCEQKSTTIDEQYSFGDYAGVMCQKCAISGYVDQCGHGRAQGTREEYEEMAGPYTYDSE